MTDPFPLLLGESTEDGTEDSRFIPTCSIKSVLWDFEDVKEQIGTDDDMENDGTVDHKGGYSA